MKLNFRKAQEKDAFKIAEMLIDIGALHHNGRPDVYKGNLQKYNEKEVTEILKNENSPVYVVADEEDNVAGYAFCIIRITEETKALVGRKYLYIDDFCVDPQYRKAGVGRFLMEKVLEEAKKSDVSSIELNVWEFNEGAIKFYEKCGFKTQKREMEIVF